MTCVPHLKQAHGATTQDSRVCEKAAIVYTGVVVGRVTKRIACGGEASKVVSRIPASPTNAHIFEMSHLECASMQKAL